MILNFIDIQGLVLMDTYAVINEDDGDICPSTSNSNNVEGEPNEAAEEDLS